MGSEGEPLPVDALLETVETGLFVVEDGVVRWGNEAFHDVVGDGPGSTEAFADLLAEIGLDELAERDDPTAVRTRRARDVALEVDLEALDDGRYVGRVDDEPTGPAESATLDRYRTVLNTVEDAIYLTDEDRRFTWVNAAVEPMLGYDREEMIGSHLFEFLSEEQIERAEAYAESLLAEDTPETVTFEMAIERKDGTTVPVETRASLLPGEGFTGTAGVVRDISERKRRRERLERQNERLEAFASIVSHDLQNPLQVAEGRLELARQAGDPEDFEALEAALDRMRELIEDLTALAMADEPLIEPAEIDLGEAAADAWATVETGSATLETDAGGVVEADEGQLQRLLENLLSNAVEHGPAETVVVGDLPDEPGFYVADDGTGIPEAEREAVFEAGYTDAPEGIGYGLTIVRDVAEAHDWTVRITESADGGARVEVVTDGEAE